MSSLAEGGRVADVQEIVQQVSGRSQGVWSTDPCEPDARSSESAESVVSVGNGLQRREFRPCSGDTEREAVDPAPPSLSGGPSAGAIS